MKFKALYKRPGKKPEVRYISNSPAKIDSLVGGHFEPLKLKLYPYESAPQVTIFFFAEAVIMREDYNFTIIVDLNDKKTWLDLSGPVVVFGRKDDELCDIDLTEDDMKWLFQEPYEVET